MWVRPEFRVFHFFVLLFFSPVFQTAVLREVAAVLVVLSTETTPMFTRTALTTLEYFGTRVRNLLHSCVWTTATLSLFLDQTATVLLVAAVLDRAVRAVQDDVVQALHQRALFNRATETCAPDRKMRLQSVLWPNSIREARECPKNTHTNKREKN